MKPEKTGKSRKLFIAAIVALCLLAATAEVILITGASKKKKQQNTPTETPTQTAQKPTATPTEPADPKTQVYTVWRMTKQYCPDPSGKEMLYREWEYADYGLLATERLYDPYSGKPITTTTIYSADLTTSRTREYSTDGDLMSTTQRYYDETGRLMREVVEQTGTDGTVTYATDWTYLDDGRVAKEERYLGANNDVLDYRISYTYDEMGRKVTYQMDTASDIHEKIHYVYDSDGNLIREETILPDGSVGSFVSREFTNGRLVRENQYQNAETLLWYNEYEYDSEGRISRRYYSDEPQGDRKYTFWRDYFYDKAGRKIGERGYNIDSPNEDGLIDAYSCIYDENGCKVKEFYTDAYGTETVERYEYIQITVPYRNLTDEEKEQFGIE
ncbi:MAG: hypothetical protein J5648_09615 [Lachnospiraceae bacterium]|nr:hypothetical protein [Lachnospiraceae bacterium]